MRIFFFGHLSNNQYIFNKALNDPKNKLIKDKINNVKQRWIDNNYNINFSKNESYTKQDIIVLNFSFDYFVRRYSEKMDKVKSDYELQLKKLNLDSVGKGNIISLKYKLNSIKNIKTSLKDINTYEIGKKVYLKFKEKYKIKHKKTIANSTYHYYKRIETFKSNLIDKINKYETKFNKYNDDFTYYKLFFIILLIVFILSLSSFIVYKLNKEKIMKKVEIIINKIINNMKIYKLFF